MLFKRFGLKMMYYVSFSIGFLGGIGIYYCEYMHSQGLLNNSLTGDQIALFNRRMPQLIFFTKFGIAIAFLSSYFACFIDPNVFPNHRRTTAIGICNFCARGLTGFAPLINELAEPFPMGLFVAILGFALVNTVFINHEKPLPKSLKNPQSSLKSS